MSCNCTGLQECGSCAPRRVDRIVSALNAQTAAIREAGELVAGAVLGVRPDVPCPTIAAWVNELKSALRGDGDGK